MTSFAFTPISTYARAARRTSAGLGVLTFVAACLSLAGWVFDIPRLPDWEGDGITMQPNTAVAVMAAGIALLLVALERPRLAASFAMLTGLIGAANLFEHISDLNLGIDTLLLFDRQWGHNATTAPGRMGPPAALSLTLLGTGFLLSARSPGQRRLAPILGLAVAGIALLSLTGYLFHVSALFTMPRLTAIALQTSMMLSVLGLGLIGAISEHEPIRMFSEDSAAGRLARQTLPFIVVLPISLALLALQGERAALYDPRMGTAIMVVVLIALLLGLLWRGGAEVRAGEAAHLQELAARRKLEAALREADRRKDEFLATLAHELRNPLAPLSNALTLLKLSDDPRMLEGSREMMERQVNHMVRLIDDLLDISRISSGKLELRLQEADAVSIVTHAVEASRPTCERFNHELRVHAPPTPVHVKADPIRLTQLISNLLSNAIKFTPHGGHIRLTLEHRGGNVVVTVTDDGIGLPQDKLEHIFGLFAQVDNSLQRVHAGLGIGLTLAERIARLHGGTIRASSDGPGKGSSFVVELPIAVEMAQPRQEHLAAKATPGRLRILVVDDNRDSAESLALLLSLDGTEIHTAFDGQEAVEAAVSLRPDAILLDIGLPRLNGYDACRRIRQQLDGDKKVAIFALTGWGQAQDRKKSLEAGFDGHLVKPVDHAELTSLLASVRPGEEEGILATETHGNTRE